MADKISQFIPELWAATIIREKEARLVFGALANRTYEGMITGQGDRVKIHQVGDIDVNTYTKNSTSDITIQYLNDAEQILDIDQAKYFAFRVDDIDKAQSKVEFMVEASRKAGYKLNKTADEYLAGLYGQCGITRNTSSSPVDMTSTNVVDEFLNVGVLMDEANVEPENRWAVIPPWVRYKLTLAGINDLTDNKEVYKKGSILNGYIGDALGFRFYLSNNVSKNSTDYDETRIICGSGTESFTFAEQIVKLESYRQTHEGFGQVVKGLHVYGGKILRPDITTCLFADKTAES